MFGGPVEVDETYFGGIRRNMSNRKRKDLANTGWVAAGKTAVAGIKDRETNKVKGKVVNVTYKKILHPFIKENVKKGAKVYTDDAAVYDSLPFDHKAIKHSLSEYVKGDVHANGIESLWSMLKRSHKGTFHKLSPKYLDRYVQEFAGRHDMREMDPIDIMGSLVSGRNRKRLKYHDLIAPNGLSNGAR